ncbi:MAG: hypothetical protein IMZ61_14525 [Planctomycetes bacterium]|nr:hypothetical protein [Planctomycetota bacterium]
MITSTYSFAVTSSIGYRNTNYERRTTSNGPVLHSNSEGGFVLPLVLLGMVILMALIIGAAMTSYGSRIQAVQTKSQTEAMLAAEAGYEQAIFWMSQRTDLLGDIQAGDGQGSINFGTGRCDYEINFHGFIGARPVFRVTSTGVCGRPSFTRVVDVDVMQETSGWAMGTCRIPSGTTSTTEVYFKNSEIVDMPLHINKCDDHPDVRDIWISTSGGHPRFLQKVEMGESRKAGSTDKYGATIISYFENGIAFDQPGVRITDETAIQSKVNRFRNSTAAAYKFTPVGTASFGGGTTKYDAVQLEFFVESGVGKVRITNNCSVKGRNANDYDYKVVRGSGGDTFEKYKIYDYHCRPNSETQTTIVIDNNSSPCYVKQTFPGGYESAPGGQIYVKGSVVIGSSTYTDMVVKGKITVVAEKKDDGTGGHIWIADSIKVDGAHDADGKPSANNPNVLGLIAQGVIKVVNPTDSSHSNPHSQTYQPIGITKSGCSSGRFMPNPTVVEAAITVGGGGWGAEDVGDRREYSNDDCDGSGNHHDDLIVRGSITEVVRGVVGLFNSSGDTVEGYSKYYYIDTRLMSGILPGDIWFSGKYIPAPAGWHDHSPD